MSISLTPDQQASLNAYVERGDFSSVEEAALRLLDERLAERALEDDNLAWAKPYVDEALADVAAGRVMSLDQHNTRMAAFRASLKG